MPHRQARCHERQLYEKLAANYGNVPSQMLLEPTAIDLSAEEKQALLDHVPLLENAGLEIADFGGNTVVLRAVPADVEPQNAESCSLKSPTSCSRAATTH